MQNERPDLHILGHWDYPAGPDAKKTVKTIYVVANTQAVALWVNGESHGVDSHPVNGYVFAFPDVAFTPGSLKAIGLNGGKPVAQEELTTPGPPAQIKLTPIVGPKGLEADGQDVLLLDVEVTDARGRRIPTDDGRIDFTVAGPAIWRGGYNSGKVDSTNNLHLNTECGINRVAVRSTLTPGVIMVTAARPGLHPARISVASHAVNLTGGLSNLNPPRLPVAPE